jgi:autotransporter-associated beta strand protein
VLHRRYAARLICIATLACVGPLAARGAVPVVVSGLGSFEGIEEPTVIYFPSTNTFENDPTNYVNIVDEGGGMIRSTLRNDYATQGWWDGDRNTANTDRQRAEVKGITGLGHQKVDQTFEYSFDFRTDDDFTATGHFCHVFQLKATDGNSGPPLVTVSLYKNGNAIQGRLLQNSDGTTTTGTPRTFSYTAGEWCHVVVRITTCASTESSGAVLASINGDAFQGITGQPIYLAGSTDYRPKWGLYRGIGVDYGVPPGDSWVEHRTVSGYIGASNLLTWNGGQNSNTWDNGATLNFLNGAAAAAFNIDDQVNFTDASNNTAVTIAGSVAPNYVRVNSSKDYTFSGGGMTGGTLRKDGSGTLTLATTNSYPGLTDVRAGTLYVTGSIGNNSLVSLTGGTLKAGSSSALGTNSTIGTQIDGGTLDVNGFNLTTEPISVQGTGASGGAIVNTGAAQTSALKTVTLTGDATLGGSGRWDIRGSGAVLSTGGNSYNLTKTGANQVSLVATSVDSKLANIGINQGELCFQTSTSSMGDPTATVSVASGAALGFYNTTNVMNKLCTLAGGTIWGESGTGAQNTFAGPISLTNAGGILDAGSALTGGTPNSNAVLTIVGPISGTGSITKNGPGTVVIAGGGNTWSGGTIVNAGILAVTSAIPGNVLVSDNATLQGPGTIGGSVTVASGGTLSTGAMPAVLHVGSLSLQNGSQAQIKLGGIAAGSQYDTIASAGPVTFGGTLQVSLVGSLVPALGNSFDILDWSTRGGAFSSVQLPALGGALGWNADALYLNGVISVIDTNFRPGDFDRDGQANAADLGVMQEALADLDNYQSVHSNMTGDQLVSIGDLNGDGLVNNADLQGLIDVLAGGSGSGGSGIATVPEPAAIFLLAAGGLISLLLRGRMFYAL